MYVHTVEIAPLQNDKSGFFYAKNAYLFVTNEYLHIHTGMSVTIADFDEFNVKTM